MKTLAFMFCIILGHSAFAMRYGDFRRSDDIEDRRDEGTSSAAESTASVPLSPEEQRYSDAANVLVRMGQATQSSILNPSHYNTQCPALKPYLQDFKKLGQTLERNSHVALGSDAFQVRGGNAADQAQLLSEKVKAKLTSNAAGTGSCLTFTQQILENLNKLDDSYQSLVGGNGGVSTGNGSGVVSAGAGR